MLVMSALSAQPTALLASTLLTVLTALVPIFTIIGVWFSVQPKPTHMREPPASNAAARALIAVEITHAPAVYQGIYIFTTTA